jgi:hypothetical protein
MFLGSFLVAKANFIKSHQKKPRLVDYDIIFRIVLFVSVALVLDKKRQKLLKLTVYC